MVYRSVVADLLHLIKDLTYVYERSRTRYYDSVTTSVKEKGHLLYAIKIHLPLIKLFSKPAEGFPSPEKSIEKWIGRLDRDYGEIESEGKPLDLTVDDAKELMEDSKIWIDNVISFYRAGSTELIQENSLSKLFPKTKFRKLGKNIRTDLREGILCILHKQPTPAAMILFRAAEGIVRAHFKALTGKSTKNLNWWDVINRLEKTGKLKHSVIGYLHYIRDKRNEAQHPDKHFTQRESESILLKIADLIEEIG